MSLFNREDKLTALAGALHKRLAAIFQDKLANTVFPNAEEIQLQLDSEDESLTSPSPLKVEVELCLNQDEQEAFEDGEYQMELDKLRSFVEIYYDMEIELIIRLV